MEHIFSGYARADGRPGIRNKVLVIYTVQCASYVAREIARLADDNDVECIGFDGCTDNEYAVRLMIACIRHPNIGAVLAVGLGCEYVQPQWLCKIALEEGKNGDWFFIQNEGGTHSSILKGVSIVEQMKKALKQTERVTMSLADLVIGAECGGSDYTSGIAGNVVVGCFFDLLCQSGGTAVFEEIVEAVGLVEYLASRAASAEAEEDIRCTYEKALAYCKDVRQYSVSPGNFAGGLSTIEEKSMGAVVKSGNSPVEGVLKVSQRPPRKGLWLLDSTPDPYWMQFGITNPNDNEGLMDLISCGAHMVFLVTGRGNVVGSAVAPVIKITGNRSTFERMKGDMDFCGADILDGRETKKEAGLRLAALAVQVAGGMLTKGERLGHKEYFIPYKYQEKGIIKRCRNSEG